MIHKWKRVKQKGWAAVAVTFTAAAQIAVAMLFPLWNYRIVPFSLIIFYYLMVIYIGFLWFSGTLFMPNLVLWLYGLVFYFSVSIPLVFENTRKFMEDDPTAIINLDGYVSSAPFLIAFGVQFLVGSFMDDVNFRRSFLQHVLMSRQRDQVIKEKTLKEGLQRRLLENMLPTFFLDQLQQERTISLESMRNLSRQHMGAAIMFADLADFTLLSSQVDPYRVMVFLNDLFRQFDKLCCQHHVYKVETIGESYIAAVGVVTGQVKILDIPEQNPGGSSFSMSAMSALSSTSAMDSMRESGKNPSPHEKVRRSIEEAGSRQVAEVNTRDMVDFACAILKCASMVTNPLTSDHGKVKLRVGIHTGPIMSGIVGTKNLKLCLLGDTVNTAARMKQNAMAGYLHVTDDVAKLVSNYPWEKLDMMEIKGKGVMQTYTLNVDTSMREDGKVGWGKGSGSCECSQEKCTHGLDQRSHRDDFDDEAVRRMGDELFGHVGETANADLLSIRLIEDTQEGKANVLRSQSANESTHGGTHLSDEAFKKHTHYFGLMFRNLTLEMLFLDGHACLHYKNVFTGYYLQIGMGFYLFIEHSCSQLFQRHVCSFDVNRDVCVSLYGDDSFVGQVETRSETLTTFKDLFRTYYVGIICSFCLFSILGCVLHYLIHKSPRIKHKAWGLVCIFAIYSSLVITVTCLVVLNRSTFHWPNTIFIFLTFIMLTFKFSGTLFSQSFVLYFITFALYVVLVMYAFIQEWRRIPDGDEKSIKACYQFSIWGWNLPFMQLKILIASYLHERTARIEFLEKVLFVHLQEEVIKQKTLKDGLQKRILQNMLPPNIVKQLQRQQYQISEGWDSLKGLSQRHFGVSMLYADLVGFTAFSATVDPSRVMTFLNGLFQAFDDLCDVHGVYKVDTVGDAYVVAAGIMTDEAASIRISAHGTSMSVLDLLIDQSNNNAVPQYDSMREHMSSTKEDVESNCEAIVSFGRAIIAASKTFIKPMFHKPATLRVGIHTGACMSGIVGTQKLKFCLLGEAVDVARAMEEHGVPGCIHATQEVVNLNPGLAWEARAGDGNQAPVEVRGRSVRTYLLRG